MDAMVGETAVALIHLILQGRSVIHGEIWNAVSVSGMAVTGEKLRVKEVRNLTLYVEHLNT